MKDVDVVFQQLTELHQGRWLVSLGASGLCGRTWGVHHQSDKLSLFFDEPVCHTHPVQLVNGRQAVIVRGRQRHSHTYTVEVPVEKRSQHRSELTVVCG